MDNKEETAHFLVHAGAYLNAFETSVLEALHLDPDIYFRAFPPFPKDESLLAEAERFYISNVLFLVFWILVWTFSFWAYGNPRHGLLSMVKNQGFKIKTPLICVKGWFLCAGMGYLVFKPKMEGAFPDNDIGSLLLIIKVLVWISLAFIA